MRAAVPALIAHTSCIPASACVYRQVHRYSLACLAGCCWCVACMQSLPPFVCAADNVVVCLFMCVPLLLLRLLPHCLLACQLVCSLVMPTHVSVCGIFFVARQYMSVRERQVCNFDCTRYFHFADCSMPLPTGSAIHTLTTASLSAFLALLKRHRLWRVLHNFPTAFARPSMFVCQHNACCCSLPPRVRLACCIVQLLVQTKLKINYAAEIVHKNCILIVLACASMRLQVGLLSGLCMCVRCFVRTHVCA